MTPLLTWTQDLLNHQANSAKIPIEKVILSFDNWKAYKNELKEALTQLETNYMENHNNPRLMEESNYTLFLNEQKELIDKWKKNKSKSALNHIIRQKREKYINDPIYTMYYYQYN